MDKDKILDEIFGDDPLNLLEVTPKSSSIITGDERLIQNFEEINTFIENHHREPEPNASNISEYKLYSRLKSLKENPESKLILNTFDRYDLLGSEPKELNSIEDIFEDDSLGIFENSAEDIFNLKHIPHEVQSRAETDFVARRKPCKDFTKYEILFKKVQKDLASGKRKLVDFKLGNLREGAYYVHNGVLFLLEKLKITKKEHYKKDGTRVREDGRTRCIFENGTESNMLKRSVEKILYANGKVVTENVEDVTAEFQERFRNIGEDDIEAGFIYVLESRSSDKRISSIKNLYKIGFSRTEVPERIRNAVNEPTYLMAPVRIVEAYKCYNLNSQKLESILHNFFGSSCLSVDVFDNKGVRHTPREWFIAPIEVVRQAIELIVTEQILGYRYNIELEIIEKKQ